MQSLQLRTRRATLGAVLTAAAASVGLLGGTAALFAGAGSTPTFVAGSKSAQEAAQCPDALSQQRHECLRHIAAAAARSSEQGAVLVARASSK